MSTSIVSDSPWRLAGAMNPAGCETGVSEWAPGDRKGRPLRKMMGLIEDAVVLLLVVLLLPLAILLFGAPVVLLVRLLIEFAERM